MAAEPGPWSFRDSEIDSDVLPELTESDLEKLGVPLGHRKRLLKAIASLGAAEKLPPALGSAPARPDTDNAERRQVTVMFSDLVGSTAIAARIVTALTINRLYRLFAVARRHEKPVGWEPLQLIAN